MIAETATQPEAHRADPSADQRLDDLAQIISAYNQVTEKLQHSHEVLEAEVARLRAELASTNAQLQRSKRLSALGEMAAGIAHEIRNPLAAIQLYAGMAIEDLQDVATGPACACGAPVLPEAPHEHAEPAPDPLSGATDAVRKIAAAVQGLSGIVNDVLTFAGRSAPEPRELLAIDVIGKALDAHFPAIDAAGVTVVREDLQHPQLTLHADPNLLHQALLNVIRNAVDAMAHEDGERTLTIDVSTGRGHLSAHEPDQPDSDEITLSIRDTGPGIPDQAIDRIFNPFFTTRGTGTGLGLAIVHRIIDAHGGAIRVSNDPDHGGAVFDIILPTDARSARCDVRCESNGTPGTSNIEHRTSHIPPEAA